jgi:multisubunit Na+/H+ antiporter MnhB subunit
MSLEWLDYLRARKGGPSLILMGTVIVIAMAVLNYPVRKEKQRLVVACLLGFVILVGVLLCIAVYMTDRRPETYIDWVRWSVQAATWVFIVLGVRRLR